jgi:hypothetical protein
MLSILQQCVKKVLERVLPGRAKGVTQVLSRLTVHFGYSARTIAIRNFQNRPSVL